MTNDERLDIIRARRTSADPRYTLEQIGTEVGLTRERVRQLCAKNGIVQPPKPPYVPAKCQVCGEPYETIRGSRRSTCESSRAHLHRTGHHTNPSRRIRVWSPNERQARMIALRQSGATIARISKEVGVTTPIVHMTLQRAGLAGSYKPERDAAIIADWESGLSRAGLVDKHGLSDARIRLILSAYIGSGKLPYLAKRKGGHGR